MRLLVLFLSCVPKTTPHYVADPPDRQQCCRYLDGIPIALVVTDGVETTGVLVQLDTNSCERQRAVVMPSPQDGVFRPVYPLGEQ